MKNRIKVERAIKNITQQELAKSVGVSRQTINALELCKYIPSTILSMRIAEFFEKRVEDIFELEDEDYNK